MITKVTSCFQFFANHFVENASKSGNDDSVSEDGKKKSKSLRGMLFGSRSKASKGKSASQGMAGIICYVSTLFNSY